MKRPLFFTVFAALACSLALTAPARAEEPPSDKAAARELYQQGSALYDHGDYAGAISFFEKAYATFPAAALLFNLAQAHRLLGPEHCRQALEFYERYQATPESAADRAEVDVRVAEMRGCLSAAQAAQPHVEAAPQPIVVSKTDTAPAPAPSRPAPAPAVPVASWVLGGVGVVGLGVFGTFAILGKNRQAELERTCLPSCAPGSVNAVKRKYLIADVGLAIGAVSLGGAGYFYFTREGGEPARSAFGGASLNYIGSF